jgi:hypothetical protein
LCHQTLRPRSQISPSAVEPLYVASLLRSDISASRDASAVCFRAPSGFAVDVTVPLAVTGLRLLAGRWPLGAFFAELVVEAREELASTGSALTDDETASQAESLAAVLLAGFASRCVLLRSLPPPFVSLASDRPSASPLARHQARSGALVTNLRHDPVQLDLPARQLLQLLDGTHDRRELVRLWPTSADGTEAHEALEAMLALLARSALLMR